MDLFSLGDFNAAEGDEEIRLLEADERRYRKLILSEGRIKGAIVLGYQQQAADVIRVSKEHLDLTAYLEDLRAGRWEVLAAQPVTAYPR